MFSRVEKAEGIKQVGGQVGRSGRPLQIFQVQYNQKEFFFKVNNQDRVGYVYR